MNAQTSYVVDDKEKGIFLLDRAVHVDDRILRDEMQKIFAKCWIYVGHASEVKKPGDFVSRKVAGRPIWRRSVRRASASGPMCIKRRC